MLRISSNIPVAILALDFFGVGFASVPITDVSGVVTVSSSAVTPVAIGNPSVATVVGVPVIPSTIGIAPTTIGVAPTTIGVAPTATGVASTETVTVPAAATGQRGIAFFQTSDFDGPLRLPAVIGSFGAFVLPQVIRGGGAATNITIGNVTSTTRAVRFDFFNADGVLVRSLPTVTIPPRGFVVFSSDAGEIFPSQ